MNVIVVDDNAYIIKVLTHYLKAYKEVEVIGTASNVQDAVGLISKKQPDVLFLDVELGDKLSFDILKQCPEFNGNVVFVTAHVHYAIQAIRHAAFDYILKPIHPEELQRVVERLLVQKNSNIELRLQALEANMKFESKYLVLKSVDKYKVVQQCDIVHLKADNTYTLVNIKGRETVLISQSIKYYEDILPSQIFMRTHRSHIINLYHVSEYIKTDGGYILMSNGEQVPLSTPKKTLFLELLEKL